MSSVSPVLTRIVATALQASGDASAVRNARAIGGGCINHAHRLETDQGRYLLKWNAAAPAGMFSAEAHGLQMIAHTHTLRVPAVLAVHDGDNQQPAYILLEWLEGPPDASLRGDQSVLGAQLAALHQTTASSYGLDQHNFIGTTPQYNRWDANWISFFRDQRLRPQIDLAGRNGYLSTTRRRQLERVVERLEQWLADVQRQPALLHGDLWGGNVIAGPNGEPVLIDPAIYFGDREAEIAYTELFGGFSARFYAAYRAVWPLAPDYADRRDLYNLYHVLNHLNLFGESYGAQVDAIARYYAG